MTTTTKPVLARLPHRTTLQQNTTLDFAKMVSFLHSFDEFKPLVAGEESLGDAQRHPKLSALFNWTNGDDSHQLTADSSSLGAKDKYGKENERGSNEVFLEAGLWVDKPTSSPRPRGRSASAPLSSDPTTSRADTAFYIHPNRSAEQLICTSDSSSTEVFSPTLFSPRLTARSESVTTENGLQALDSTGGHKYDDELTSTPSPTTTRISPGAPPNTPWNPASPDLELLSRAGKESSNRRRARKPVTELDRTYSFIAFSSPPRVALETTLDTERPGTPQPGRTAKPKPSSTTAGFFTPRPKTTSAVTTKRTPSAPLLTPVTISTVVGTEPSKSELPRVSSNSIVGKAREGDFVSSFAEDLNKALDILDSLASSHDAARLLALGTTAKTVGEMGEANVFNKSPILGSNLSRFSNSPAPILTKERHPATCPADLGPAGEQVAPVSEAMVVNFLLSGEPGSFLGYSSDLGLPGSTGRSSSCIPSSTRCIENGSWVGEEGISTDVSASLTMPGAFVGDTEDEGEGTIRRRKDTSGVMMGTVRLRDSIFSGVSGFFSN
ncbi:hypothetical protein FA13DRAFT_154616 [Coprinellus micaceus]|uniref:Uncharacterized protein n=1 Tax=Coprinellus micaceus TaxID=71717 RepID=A0A4Y7THM6_COPMI|nr:hypothetical protein FA13DRAFT_154616 [Coprinellus micaceus]